MKIIHFFFIQEGTMNLSRKYIFKIFLIHHINLRKIGLKLSGNYKTFFIFTIFFM